MKRHTRIKIEDDSYVHLLIGEPDNNLLKGCVIFSHGFMAPGFESHRMFLYISNKLNKIGYKTVLFDYRGSGYSDLDFSEINLNTEIKDLNEVISYIVKNEKTGNKLCLWGQSLGSGIVGIVAPERPEIDCVLFWSLSANLYERYLNTLGSDLIEKGSKYLPTGFQVSKEFLLSLKDYDVYNSISKINRPKLFVHGTADEKADYSLSQNAYNISSNPKKIVPIADGNHSFKAQPHQFDEAVNKSIQWLELHMNE